MSDDKTTVEIELGEGDERVTYLLQPKLSAMKVINRLGPGYAGTFRHLNDFDMDVMAGIIIAGTGTIGQNAKTIIDQVYRANSEELQPKLVRFVNICAAGGRDPDAVRASAGDDEKN